MRYILSIDGGGIRGILPATLLTELWSKAPKQFDLVAGTSTGGIMACGMAKGLKPDVILDLYVKHGTEVFDHNPVGGLFNAKYDAGKLRDKLKEVLGAGTKLSDIQAPELLVPAYCVKLPKPTDTDGDGVEEGACTWFFKSWKARADTTQDFPLWQVARATSAAPMYFPAATPDGNYIMVDGGVFANNPALCALAAARKLWPNEEYRVLSIGTGSKVAGIDAGDWGGGQWAKHIISVLMDGSADVMCYLCKEQLNGNFLRCESALTGVDDAFDNASKENIAALQKLAAKFTVDHIQNVIDFLKP